NTSERGAYIRSFKTGCVVVDHDLFKSRQHGLQAHNPINGVGGSNLFHHPLVGRLLQTETNLNFGHFGGCPGTSRKPVSSSISCSISVFRPSSNSELDEVGACDSSHTR